jgi:hypothetical protein
MATKRPKTLGRSFNEEMMALVGEYAAAAPVSVAVYCEFDDALHLDSIITRVRPGVIEGKQVARAPIKMGQPMQLLSLGAVEAFLRVTRDGAVPQSAGAVVYTGATTPPVKFDEPDAMLEAFKTTAITGGDIWVDNQAGTITRDEIATKVATYVWKILN